MKRLFCLMTLLALILSLPLSASADLIYEPWDDFFEEHQNECDYVNRSYIANGPDGELIVYTSPENCLIQAVIPNMEKLYISHTYRDENGIKWGCAEPWNDENVIGWVPMPYVVPIYNSSDFGREFEDRIKNERGDLLEFAGQEIRVWEYPGSYKSDTLFVQEDPYLADLYMYHSTFVDDAGRKWVKIIHKTCSWVYLDNPTTNYNTIYAYYAPQQVSQQEILPVTEEATAPTTEPETEPQTEPTTHPETEPTTRPETEPTTRPQTEPTTQPTTPEKIITPSGISPSTILIAAATVAAISAILLALLKKKKT